MWKLQAVKVVTVLFGFVGSLIFTASIPACRYFSLHQSQHNMASPWNPKFQGFRRNHFPLRLFIAAVLLTDMRNLFKCWSVEFWLFYTFLPPPSNISLKTRNPCQVLTLILKGFFGTHASSSVNIIWIMKCSYNTTIFGLAEDLQKIW